MTPAIRAFPPPDPSQAQDDEGRITHMETIELTVRLPKENLEFAKRYAREHGLTVTELIGRYLKALQAVPKT
jgi:hypothetical protein